MGLWFPPFAALCFAAVAAAEERWVETGPMAHLGGDEMTETTCRGESATACAGLFSAEPGSDVFVQDRLLRAAVDTARDPDCMARTVDASSPGFVREVVYLFRKCRSVVVRNAFDREYMREYAREFERYVGALRNQTVTGTTTHGEHHVLKNIGHDRWLLLMPEAFAAPEVVSPKWLDEFLSHPRVLGPHYRLNDLGAAVSERLGRAQQFHMDDDWLLGEDSLAMNGLGGHDIPPTAVTALHPITPELLTLAHGPTDFCMGTSWLGGLPPDKVASYRHAKNKSLADERSATSASTRGRGTACPSGARRRRTAGRCGRTPSRSATSSSSTTT